MENWQIWCLIGLAFLFLLGLFLIYLSDDDEGEKNNTFSPEDFDLAEFLNTRQAVNEDFLKAQNQLLKQLFEERRRS